MQMLDLKGETRKRHLHLVPLTVQSAIGQATGSTHAAQKENQRAKAHEATENNPDSDSDQTISIENSYMATYSAHQPDLWLKDSGSTNHICHDKSAFLSIRPHKGAINGIQSQVDPLVIEGIGDVRLRCFIPGKPDRHIMLRKVSYCPMARDNLISEGRIDKTGHKIMVEGGVCTILDEKGRPTMMGQRRHNLYEMDCIADPHSSESVATAFSA